MDEELFGPYRLEELIGRGGMGEVYRAFDTVKRRPVAVKVLSPQLAADSRFQARFRHESEIAARLRNPHVIPIHEYGEIDGRLFIDMRLVDGVDLDTVVARDGHMVPDRAVDLIAQVAAALADGLVHRDVKPSNVLLTDTADEFAYLVDFGIAAALDGEALTGAGTTLGTVSYMAPELFETDSRDSRIDVYSLACVLYKLLTGRRPFEADGFAALMYAHVNVTPPRPSQLSAMPTTLDEIVARGMAKDPDRRFRHAGELAEAARDALEGARPAPMADLGHWTPPVPVTDVSMIDEQTIELRTVDPTPHPEPAAEPDDPPAPRVGKRRPLRWVLLAVVALLLLGAGAVAVVVLPSRTADNTNSFVDADGRFTLQPPPGWVADSSGRAMPGLAFLDRRTQGGAVIGVEAVTATGDLNSTADTHKALAAKEDGYQPGTDDPITLNDGTPARLISYTVRDVEGGGRLRYQVVVAVRGPTAMILIGVTSLERWDADGPPITAALKSLTVAAP